MPSQVITSVENNFTKGLITEATGLNFPENAATSASNCVFTLIGDVTRREGINFELNGTTFSADRTSSAMSTYVWNNPGGDGNSKLLVKQIGQTLYFYSIAATTNLNPLSQQLLVGTVVLNPVSGNTFNASSECQYSDGIGYLFVCHPSCDPIYVTYDPTTFTIGFSNITIQIRDFIGVVEPGLGVTVRPNILTTDHQYNLQNQGWSSGNSWFTTSQTVISPPGIGSFSVTAGTGLSISNGDVMTMTAVVNIYTRENLLIQTLNASMSGSVTGYTSGTGALTLNITAFSDSGVFGYGGDGVTQQPDGVYHYIAYPWQISSVNKGLVNTWHTDEGNYPSNSDIWWTFKDTTGVFNPTTTQPNVSISSSNAPQGHYVFNAFNMDRNNASGLSGINVVSTLVRPTTSLWFQGRVFYTGVNASQGPSPDTAFYTWTENIYFSQTVESTSDFGLCYQINDPSSETLNGELPIDGGVFPIVGSGTIHKLFRFANGLLVFANNGVWFITGSQGIGFAANDFTVTQISQIKCLSAKSFVDVNGTPYFWNEEGIYTVMQSNSGQLAVEPITVGTILTYYNGIPLASKKYARGSYDPINYTIQWCYRSTQESSVTDRYQYDTILNYNTYNKAFFPYNISTGSSTQYIHGVDYISYPYISNVTPSPDFKYHCSEFVSGSYLHGFAEEYDTTYVDWGSVSYTSTFTTGFKLHGQALKKFQVPYLYTYSRNNGYAAYYVQGTWDYASNSNSNRWSMPIFVEINNSNYEMIERRHKIRGKGYVFQLMVTSVPGKNFDLMGWAMYDNISTGV